MIGPRSVVSMTAKGVHNRFRLSIQGLRCPSSACRHLLPVNGEKGAGRNLGVLPATPATCEAIGAGFFLPVTILGVEEWSAKRTESQLLGFSNDERPAGQ